MGVIGGIVMGLLRVIGGLVLLALRFALPILALLGLRALLRRRDGQAREKQPREEAEKKPHFHGPVYTVNYQEVEEEPAISEEPDGPAPFGYKTCWLAVRCGEAERVMEVLGLSARRPANWTTGIEAAYDGRGVFVSPPLDGFVLVIGLSDRLGETGEDPWLAELAGTFPQVQFFATHRVAEYHRWGMYAQGRLVRDYCYVGETGQVLRDEGDWTAQEIALGFGRFPRLGQEDACEDFPNEEDVLDIAAAWGVDPRFERQQYPPSAGWLCTWQTREKEETS